MISLEAPQPHQQHQRDPSSPERSSWVRPLRWDDVSVTVNGSPQGDEFALPIGTVTFLLTDVENSTLAWQAAPAEMGPAIALHYEILDRAVSANGGVRPQEQGEGDSIVAAFGRASDALRAAAQAQVELDAQRWPGLPSPLKVRMAVHAGEAQLRNEANYVGRTIIRTARLRAIAHGGQVVISQAARDLALDQIGDEFTLIDMGIHRLKDLARPEHVWQLVLPGVTREFPPLRSLDASPNNLPTAGSTFVGRQREVDAVVAVSSANRLVTIVGAGGAGKTRLALQAAAHIADQFVDGAWWVELAPVESSDVARVTADVLSVSNAGSLADRLKGREMLLVFDNCEHVLDAVAPLVEQLLQRCPNVRLLATSRGPLGVPGEFTWRVPPFSVPAESERPFLERLIQYEAVRLFVDRASRARPNFTLTNENGPAVAEICSRLDGLPLAIELAAARAKSITPQQILSGLEGSMRLLTGGSRLLMPRQQTLEASIAWSHDLLAETEKVLLRRISVFVGGFDLDAAEHVCADEAAIDQMQILDSLERLIDQSLVQLDDVGPAARYSVLETVRQFGAARLTDSGEALAIAGKHCDHYLALARNLAPRCETAEQDAVLLRLVPERSNLAAALRYTRDQRTLDDFVWAICSLAPFWATGAMPLQGKAFATEALDLVGATSPLHRVALLRARIQCLQQLGQMVLAHADATECLSVAGSAQVDYPVGRVRTLVARLASTVDPERGQALYDGAEQALRATGDEFGLVMLRVTAVIAAIARGDHRLGRALAEELWPIVLRLNCPTPIVILDSWLAGAATECAHHAAYRFHMDRYRKLRSTAVPIAVQELTYRVMYAFDLGLPEPTYEELEAKYAETERLGYESEAISMLLTMIVWTLLHGQYERALALAGSGEDPRIPPAQKAPFIHVAAMALCGLGRVDEASALLAQVAVPAAAVRPVPFSTNRLIAGQIALLRGNHTEAESLAHQSLEVSVSQEMYPNVFAAFGLLTALAADRGSWKECARLAGIVAALRDKVPFKRGRNPWSLAAESSEDKAKVALGVAAYQSAFDEGASLDLPSAFEYVRRARGHQGRPTIGWTALTPTERRVAELVRSGKSNAEVAAELLMGAETVKTHLSRVFAKLGVGNRTKLAAFPTPPD